MAGTALSSCSLDYRTEERGGAARVLGSRSEMVVVATSEMIVAGSLREQASHMGPTQHW